MSSDFSADNVPKIICGCQEDRAGGLTGKIKRERKSILPKYADWRNEESDVEED